MEITIKIAFSPGEEKGAASVVAIGGPAPSLESGVIVESARPAELASIQKNAPIPEALAAEPLLTQEAPTPSMIVGESPPVPMQASHAGQESPVPGFIPGIASGKEPKE
jgi:hypothetical protein